MKSSCRHVVRDMFQGPEGTTFSSLTSSSTDRQFCLCVYFFRCVSLLFQCIFPDSLYVPPKDLRESLSSTQFPLGSLRSPFLVLISVSWDVHGHTGVTHERDVGRGKERQSSTYTLSCDWLPWVPLQIPLEYPLARRENFVLLILPLTSKNDLRQNGRTHWSCWRCEKYYTSTCLGLLPFVDTGIIVKIGDLVGN